MVDEEEEKKEKGEEGEEQEDILRPSTGVMCSPAASELLAWLFQCFRFSFYSVA